MRLRSFDKVVYHIFLSYFKIGTCEVQNEIETKQNEMKQNETKSNRNETKSKRNLSNETKRKEIEQNQIYIV